MLSVKSYTKFTEATSRAVPTMATDSQRGVPRPREPLYKLIK